MKMAKETQARGETASVQQIDEAATVSEAAPQVETEEEKALKAKEEAEVVSILASLGVEPVTEDVKEGHVSINSEFYTERMNEVNELRQTVGTIANRLMISLIGEYKLDLEAVEIDPSSLSPAVFNKGLQAFAQNHFDNNIDKLYDATKGSASVEEAFRHAATILSHTVGFSIKEEYVCFDLLTVQVLHMMQKQFHTAYVKDEMKKDPASEAESPAE